MSVCKVYRVSTYIFDYPTCNAVSEQMKLHHRETDASPSLFSPLHRVQTNQNLSDDMTSLRHPRLNNIARLPAPLNHPGYHYVILGLIRDPVTILNVFFFDWAPHQVQGND